MQSFIMNSHEVFIHIYQGCFAGTGAIVRLPQCQWSKPDGYGKISQCRTTTKHSKAKTVCIFLGIYCISCCYHHQIGSINLTHHHICPWLCASDVCYIIFCHLLHIHSGKNGILFLLLLCSLWGVQIVGYVFICRLCSSVCILHHLIIIIVQTNLNTLNL